MWLRNTKSENMNSKYYRKQLFKAVEVGNFEKCKVILEKIRHKNPPNQLGVTPLHIAAKNGYLEIVRSLLGKVQNKNPACHEGITPLHKAAENGHFHVCKFILDSFRMNHNKDKNPPSNNGTTPLHLAALNGHLNVCKFILEKIPNKNFKCNTAKSALHNAAQSGNLGICKFLLDLSEDKNPSNQAGKTPLHIAVENGHYDITKLFLEVAEDKNSQMDDGTTPLHIASEKGHFDIFKLIFEMVENKNPPRKDGWTPLHIVAEKGPRIMYKVLYQQSSKKDGTKEVRVEKNMIGYIYIYKLILDMMKTKGQIFVDGWTFLDVTAYFGYFDVGELLLKDIDKFMEKSTDVGGQTQRILNDKTKNSLMHLMGASKFGVCNVLGAMRDGEMTKGDVNLLLAMNAGDLIDYKDWANLRKKILTTDSVKLELNYFHGKSSSYLVGVKNKIASYLEESIKNAFHYVKSFLKNIDVSNEFFNQNLEINLSAIEGDSFICGNGSSAGCAFATVLISLALNKPICQNLAMTGAISPDGKVGDVEGIDLKVAAVVEAGLGNVIIPKSNKIDFEVLSADIRESVTVHFAETFEDVYKTAFQSDL